MEYARNTDWGRSVADCCDLFGHSSEVFSTQIVAVRAMDHVYWASGIRSFDWAVRLASRDYQPTKRTKSRHKKVFYGGLQSSI